MNKKIVYNVGFKADPSGLKAIQSSLAEIQNLKLSHLRIIDPNKTQADLDKIKQMAGQVGNALKSSFNPNLNTVNIESFNRLLKESGLTIQQVKNGLLSAGSTGATAFGNLTKQLVTSSQQLKQNHSMLDSIGKTLVNTIKWSIASTAINTITQSVKNAWNYVVNLDSALNDIRIVTGKSADEMEKFAQKANDAAKTLGSATKAYVEASLIYYQQGLGDKDVQARTQTTIKAANVTGQSAKEVSEQLTAVWNGYRVVANEAEKYVDKLAAVAASTAADLEELSDGMSKVASAASTMGVDIDQLSAQLSTIISVTRQDAASVGTALKTIYARMGDLQVDGVDEFGTTLGDVSGKLQQMGIDVLDQQGNLRDMGAVIEEVAGKWGTWTDAQRQAAAVAIAGKRQYNNLIALFENWDMYETALTTSKGSEGTLERQQSVYMESIEGHLKQLSVAGERVYQNLFDSESMKGFIDGLTSIVTLVGDFVEGLGGGGNLLLLLGPLLTKMLMKPLGGFVTTFVSNMQINKSNMADLAAQQEMFNKLSQAGVSVENQKLPIYEKILKLRAKQLSIERFLTDEQREQNNKLMDVGLDRANKTTTLAAQVDETFGGEEEQEKIDPTTGQPVMQKKKVQKDGQEVEVTEPEKIPSSTNALRQMLGKKGIKRVSGESFGFEGRTAREAEDYTDRDAYQALLEERDLLEKTKRQRQRQIGKLTRKKEKGKEELTSEETSQLNELTKQEARHKELTAVGADGKTNNVIEAARLAAKKEEGRNGTSGSIQEAIAYNEQLEKRLKLMQDIAATAKPSTDPNATEGATSTAELAENLVAEETNTATEATNAETDSLTRNSEAKKNNANLTKEQKANNKEVASVLKMVTAEGNENSTMYKKLKESLGLANEKTTEGNAKWKMFQQILGLAGDEADMTEDQYRLFVAVLKDLNGVTTEAVGATQQQEMQLKKIKPAVDENTEANKRYKQSLEQTQKAQKSGQVVQGVMSAAGAMMSLYSVMTQIQQLGDIFKNQDLSEQEKTSQIVGVILGLLMSVVSVFSSLIPLTKLFGTSSTVAGTQAQAAGIQAQSGWLPLLIITAIIIAAMLIIIGITALITHACEVAAQAGDNGKKAFEDASKAAEQLNEHLKDVKERYEELKESFENNDGMLKALDNMVRGSAEWYDQINKINDQVLEMVTEFPELAQYLETDVDGVMRITEEGKEKALELNQQKVAKAQQAAIAANAQVTAAKNSRLLQTGADDVFHSTQYAEDTKNKALWGGIAGIAGAGGLAGLIAGPVAGSIAGIVGLVGGIVELATYEDKIKKYEQETDKAYSSAMSYLSTDVGSEYLAKAQDGDAAAMTELRKALVDNAGVSEQYVDKLLENTKALSENMAAYKANTAAIFAQNKQLAQSSLSETVEDFNNLDIELQGLLTDSVAVAMDPNNPDNKAARQGLENDLKNNKSGTRGKIAEEYAANLGLDYQSYSFGDDGSVTFKMSDGSEHVISASGMATEVQTQRALKEAEKVTNTIIPAYTQTKQSSKQSVKAGVTTLTGDAPGAEAVLASMSGGKNADFSRLSPNQLQYLIQGINPLDGFNEKEAKKFFGFDSRYDLNALATATGYKNTNDWLKALSEGYKKYQEQEVNFSSSKASQSGIYSGKNVGLYSQAERNSIEQTYNSMAQMVGGSSATTQAAFNKFAADLNEQELLDFTKAFEEMDWTDPYAMNQFIAKMEELGIEMEGEAWDNFATAFSSAELSVGNMLKNIKSFKQNLASVLEITQDLELGGEISSEDYNNLIALDPSLADNFVSSLNGYTYIGGINNKDLISQAFDPNKYRDSVEKGASAAQKWAEESKNSNGKAQSFEALSETEKRAIFTMAGQSYDSYMAETDESKRETTLKSVQDFVFNSDGTARTADEILEEMTTTFLSGTSWSFGDLKNYKDNGKISDEIYSQFIKLRVGQLGSEIGVESTSLANYAAGATDVEMERLSSIFTQIKAFSDANPLEPVEQELNKIAKDYEKLTNLDDLTESIEKQVALEEKKINLLDQELARQREIGETLYQNELAKYGLSIQYNEDGSIDTNAIRARMAHSDLDEEEYAILQGILEWADGYNENLEEVDSTYQSILDKQIELANKKVQILIDYNEALKEWDDFTNKINKLKVGLSFFEEKESSINTILNNAKKYAQEYSLTDTLINNVGEYFNGTAKETYTINGEFDEAKFQEGFKTAVDNAKKQFESLTGYLTKIYSGFLTAQEEIIAAYDEEIEKLSSINELISSSADLWKLVGKNNTNYSNQLNSYYKTMANNSKINYQLSLSKMADAQKEYDLIMAMGDEATAELKDKVTKNLQAASKEVVSSLESTLEALNKHFSNSLTAIIDEAFVKVSKMDLETLTEDWGRTAALDERYLDDVNANYAIYQLNRNFEKSIDETDNIAAQNQLKQKQVELEQRLTKIREQQGKLRQADIDRANAEYELILKKIALEEAQRTANKMKLTRDAMGNYTYQYVTDEDEIAKAEEELAAAQNNLYNQDKSRLQSLVDDYYSIWSEYNEALTKAQMSGDEEQIKKVQDYYLGENGLLKNIQKELKYVAEDFGNMGTSLEGPEWVSNFLENARQITEMDVDAVGASVNELVTTTQGYVADTITLAEQLLVGKESPLTKAANSLQTSVKSAETVANKTAEIMTVANNAILLLPGLLQEAQTLATNLDTYGKGYLDTLKNNVGKQEAALNKNTAATEKLSAIMQDYADDKNINGSVSVTGFTYMDGLWSQNVETK